MAGYVYFSYKMAKKEQAFVLQHRQVQLFLEFEKSQLITAHTRILD